MNLKKLPYETLHCHTRHSDGQLDYKEVLDECKKNKIGVVAFTDHDAVPHPRRLKQLEKLKHEVSFFPGIELSANFVREVKGKISLFHIVGLFIDPENKELRNFCHWAKQKRLERAVKIVNNLSKLGFDISISTVEQYAKGEIIGRPHIVKAILAKTQNLEILDQILKKMPAAAKKEILTHDRRQQVFDLVLDDHSFVKGIYVHYLYPISMDEGVRLIRGAGGIALLAHWSYYKDKVGLPLVEKFCREKRIDGLETVYGFEVDLKRAKEFAKDREDLSKLAQKYHLVEGGGGDFHNQEDFKQMLDPGSQALAEKTVGMVEKILQIRYNR